MNGLTPLTIGQRQTLEGQLRKNQARLRAEIGDALRATGSPEAIGFANQMENIDDQAVADLQSSLDLAAVQRDIQELLEVEAALKRLKTPQFGICAVCEAPIPFSRLQAHPAATRCVNCQTAVERDKGDRNPARL